ncbi:hypothetical protein LCGC14_2331190, partial [marine sediment metagenome]
EHGKWVWQVLYASGAPVRDSMASAADRHDALAAAKAEIERLRALLDEATTNPEGDYYLGLRCGVEDRDIYDRYAAEYGWDQAFEYVASVAGPAPQEISESSPGETEPTPETGLSLSDALPECMFRFCPTLDKCKANGCPTPRPQVYESKTGGG